MPSALGCRLPGADLRRCRPFERIGRRPIARTRVCGFLFDGACRSSQIDAPPESVALNLDPRVRLVDDHAGEMPSPSAVTRKQMPDGGRRPLQARGQMDVVVPLRRILRGVKARIRDHLADALGRRARAGRADSTLAKARAGRAGAARAAAQPTSASRSRRRTPLGYGHLHLRCTRRRRVTPSRTNSRPSRHASIRD